MSKTVRFILSFFCLIYLVFCFQFCTKIIKQPRPEPEAQTQTAKTPPTLEELIQATGYKFKAYDNNRIFILNFPTDVAEFPVIIRWNSDKRNYVSIKLIFINQPDGYEYSIDVLRHLNLLNINYDTLKFIADKDSGDIQLAFNLDAEILSEEQIKEIISAEVLVAEKEFNALLKMVLTSDF